MANEENRTRQPTRISEEQARTVVGGDDGGAGDPGVPMPVYDPCGQSGCSCQYSNAEHCSCGNHPHIG